MIRPLKTVSCLRVRVVIEIRVRLIIKGVLLVVVVLYIAPHVHYRNQNLYLAENSAVHQIYDLKADSKTTDLTIGIYTAMRTQLQSSDLKSVLASTAKRQNLLADVHPAIRILPIAALFCADFLQRNYGWDPFRKFFPSLSPTPIQHVDSRATSLQHNSLPASQPGESRRGWARWTFGQTALVSVKYPEGKK